MSILTNKIKNFKDAIKILYKSTFQLKKFKVGFYLILRFLFDLVFVYLVNIKKYKKIKTKFYNVIKNNKVSYNWFGDNVQIWFYFFKKLNFLKKKNIKFLELGSFEGLSILYLFYLYGDRIEIDSVDVLDKKTIHFKNFLKNTKKIKKLTFFNKWTKHFLVEAHKKKKQYDIIYVDASHYYEDVFFDAKICFQLLKGGGIMIFDDLVHNWTKKKSAEEGHMECHNVIGGVLLFLDYLNQKKTKIKILYVGKQLIIQKK